MNDNILEVNDLCKEFGAFRLKGVSFSLPRGFIMGLIGPNGAGKTTTIKLILNMLKKDGGSVRLFGLDGTTERACKEKLGVVMDQTFYADEWKLYEVERVLSRFYEAWDSEMFSSHLRRFGLDANKKVKELSRGMKMKLMIAAALSHGAELLLLDEPTSGLDAVARDELLEILSEFILNGDKSVLFSTHITADLEKTADFLTYIEGGEVRYTGTKDGLLEKYCLVRGGLGMLSPRQREKLIGYREHSVGFDALAERASLRDLPAELTAEAANLDEIVVRFHGEGERI